jgi:hypothetical protein
MIAAVIGSAILTVLVVLNSRGAIKYFLGFPVYVRAAAGVRGASLYILVRAVVAIVYFATQTYYGGRITSVFMRGIFGNGYHNIPNHLPASAGITSRDLLSFFLFWMVCCLLWSQCITLTILGTNACHVYPSDSSSPSLRCKSYIHNNCLVRCPWLGDLSQWRQYRRVQVHYKAEPVFRIGSHLAHDSS